MMAYQVVQKKMEKFGNALSSKKSRDKSAIKNNQIAKNSLM
jgi:hypothetical protein